MTQPSPTPTWQRLGSWAGGPVLDVAYSPNFAADKLALAATTAGLYRSIDEGWSWQRTGTDLAEASFLALAWAPTNRRGALRVYAAGESGRLFTSGDGGLHWQEVSSWAGLGRATQLALSPAFDHDQTLFAATAEGVLRSQDGGLSWERSVFGLHDLETLCLALSPDFAASELLWCGAANGGFYRSRNAARSWRDAGQGLPDDAFTALLVSPTFADDQTIYVGGAASGLFRSNDGGLTWQALFADLAGAAITALALAENRLLLGTTAGLLIASDGGHAWQPASGAPFAVTALAVGGRGVVLAATPDGIYRSSDGGLRWQAAHDGLVAHAPPVVQRAVAGALLALDRAGSLALSVDEGRSWQRVDGPAGPSAITALTLAAAADRLFVATAEGQIYTAGLDEALDTWQACPIQAPADQLFEQIVAPSEAAERGLILATTEGQLYRWDGSDVLVALAEEAPWTGSVLLQLVPSPTFATDGGLVAVTAQPNQQNNYALQAWESSDGGVTWQTLATLESETPAVAVVWPADPVERSLLLATRNRVIRIFRPGAANDLALAQHFLDEQVRIITLAASPSFAVDRRLWAATSAGIFASRDAGATWTSLGDDLADRVCVGVFPLNAEGALLAVELGGTIWRYQG